VRHFPEGLCALLCECRRNPSYNASRIVYCVVLAVLLGTIYLWKGQARSTYNDISNMWVCLLRRICGSC
jgi:hypothetical protein